ncbi:MAG TPA: mechanosensitive ion channel domain-containing protein [Nakamurella sp.]
MEITPPECAADPGSLCQWVWDNTGADYLASNSDEFVSTTLHILAILLIAFAVRFLIYRAINRLTRLSNNDDTSAAMRPLRAGARFALAGGMAADRRAQRTRAVGSLLKSVTSFVVICVAGVLILAELGFDVAPILTSAGIAGVALAFGAQNLVRDFLAGIFMTLEDQYGVGDTVDLGSASGTVVAVSLRTTTLRAGDGTIWHVRNGEVLRVGNASQGRAVVTIPVTVPYDSDTDRAGTIALQQATGVAESPEFEASILEPPTLLGITDVAPGTITIGIEATVLTGDKEGYTRAVRAAIRSAFERTRQDDPTADFRPPVLVGGPAAEPKE